MKVLIVTYHFPPDAEVGAVRPYQLARYLPEFGIEPWVLTVQAGYAETPNVGLAATGVPEERIIRTKVHPFAYQYAVSAWKGFRRLAPSRRVEPERQRVNPPPRQSRGAWARDVLGFPDERIGWYLPALRAAQDAVARIGFDAIVSTSPPRVATMVAASLARRFRLPWLMDLRDPWWGAFDETDATAVRNGMLTRLHRRLFSSYVKRASLIVHNTERLSRQTSQLVPQAAARTRCVPNGIDPAWEARESGAKQVHAFRIGYYGQIMGRRSPAAFLHGLQRWIAERRPEASDTEVRFYGSGFEEVRQLTDALQLHETVRVCGALPRESVPAEMADDFALLLIANAQPLQIPGKAYEYVASGRRILAMTELDGATAEFLKPIPGCLLAENAGQVALALSRLYDDYKAGSGSWVDRRGAVSELQYRRRVERFSELIRECASRPS